MFDSIRKLLGAGKRPVPARHAAPAGERIYAIGDIHGCLDLFEELIEAIERDDSEAAPATRTTVILLGDLVDRGPDSAAVVARAREWQARRAVRILAGNHEEMFLESFENIEILRHFLKHGGRETLLSYGLAQRTLEDATLEELFDLMPQLVPPQERAFIAGFENAIVAGDYLFVHAGIRPGVPLEEQERKDMLWIREPFLKSEQQHPFMVVHGHTICETADEQPNRIGIDTGAFRSGILTALVIESDRRRYVQAVRDGGIISIHKGESPQ